MLKNKNLITQKLKYQINDLEKSLNIQRVMFNKSRKRTYFINYRYYETKGVKSSAVYQYKFNDQIQFGISFNYEEDSQFNNRKVMLPLKEQTVVFSLCFDTNEKNKMIDFSKEYYFEEAKSLLKKVNGIFKDLNEISEFKKITPKEKALILKKYLLKQEIRDEKKDLELLNNYLSDCFNDEKELEQKILMKEKEKEGKMKYIIEECKNSLEQKRIFELEKELKDTRKKLIEKEKYLIKKTGLNKTKKDLKNLEQQMRDFKLKIEEKCKNFIVDNSMSKNLFNLVFKKKK